MWFAKDPELASYKPWVFSFLWYNGGKIEKEREKKTMAEETKIGYAEAQRIANFVKTHHGVRVKYPIAALAGLTPAEAVVYLKENYEIKVAEKDLRQAARIEAG